MRISQSVLEEIKKALRSVPSYGSIEMYVQNGKLTQITVRNIKKTSNLQIQDE